jgi:uncharacterized protein YgbK (DUF1537 family)
MTTKRVLAAVADDVTGGTDLASLWRREGLTVMQTFGVPSKALPPADAIVVSCKTRTAPVADAVTAARAAFSFLRQIGASQLYFKYCSTFDSTDTGNIGPVIEAGLDYLNADFTIACPAYPALQRTVYRGHLFVGDALLSDSPMRSHPLTPMTDSNLVRVLQRQCKRTVGLIPFEAVESGPVATHRCLMKHRSIGDSIVIADALNDEHLDTLAVATSEFPFVTGGAALGGVLARQRRGQAPCDTWHPPEPTGGAVAVLSGSCSEATRRQVSFVAERMPSLPLDPVALDNDYLRRVGEWAMNAMARGSLLIYSTAEPMVVEGVHATLGRQRSAKNIEDAFGRIAQHLAAAGVRHFIVAGGETAGAVIDALGIKVMAFGDEIDPGVPWAYSVDPPGYTLALKSGNFGSHEFFAKAVGVVHE